jgi:hypothetical protein
LKSANALISIGEDYPIAGPVVSILAQSIGIHEKAMWAWTEVRFPAIGAGSLCRFALEAHVVRMGNYGTKAKRQWQVEKSHDGL